MRRARSKWRLVLRRYEPFPGRVGEAAEANVAKAQQVAADAQQVLAIGEEVSEMGEHNAAQAQKVVVAVEQVQGSVAETDRAAGKLKVNKLPSAAQADQHPLDSLCADYNSAVCDVQGDRASPLASQVRGDQG